MNVTVTFSGGQAELEIDPNRLVGSWHGPAARPRLPLRQRVRAALEEPHEFPPLRSAVVPGDRVVLPVSRGIPELDEILAAICEVLQEAGVDRGDLTVLWPGPAAPPSVVVPEGVALDIHDPEDRSKLAYLASTTAGRRVYLNRRLTDADLVVAIGRLGFDPTLGFAGPWSAVFPAQSDTAARRESAAASQPARPDPDQPTAALAEAAEVGWLLGSAFHVGVAVDREGPAAIVAGLDAAVRREGSLQVDREWTVPAPETAGLVVAGIGRPGEPAGWAELAAGLAVGGQLVRPGGKLVLLSRVAGNPGPALQHLSAQVDPAAGTASLRGHRDADDYPIARQIAETLSRADVYLLSELHDDLVEGLGLVPLSRPEEARRLAALADSVFVLESAEWVRVAMEEE